MNSVWLLFVIFHGWKLITIVSFTLLFWLYCVCCSSCTAAPHVSSACAPLPGLPVLPPPQHPQRQPDQHLHFPSTQQFRGRLWWRRVQSPWGHGEESCWFHCHPVAQEENWQREEPLLPGVHPQPKHQRQTQHIPGPEWSDHHGAAHPHLSACLQHGEGQRGHGECIWRPQLWPWIRFLQHFFLFYVT